MTAKPVIFIGGTAGTGKTSLANLLLCRCDLDHRIGTGFIRAILQSEQKQSDDFLSLRTFQSANPTALVSLQAARMKPAIAECVRRARSEGTSLVIEGTHLLPEVMRGIDYDAFLVLRAPAPDKHREQLNGARHAHREVTDDEMARCRMIDELYLVQGKALGLPMLEWAGDLGPVLEVLDLDESG